MPSSRANNERGDLWLQFPVTSSFRRESEVSRSALKLLLKCSRYAVIFAFAQIPPLELTQSFPDRHRERASRHAELVSASSMNLDPEMNSG